MLQASASWLGDCCCEQLLHSVGHQRPLLAHALRLQADSHQRRTGSQRQQLVTLGFVTVGKRARQPGPTLGQTGLRAGDLLAAALDGRQQTAGLMTDQQQHSVAGGLFEAFEQGVGSVDVHRLNRLDQHHLAPTQLRRLHHESHQFAHLVDLDRLVGFLGFEDKVVRVAAGLEQQAGLAPTTGLQALGLLAQQTRHQALGQGPFADTLRPMQQVCVGVLAAAGQLLPEGLLPGKGLSHGIAPRCPAAAHR